MSAGDILLIIIAALVMTAIVVYVAAKISEWRNPPKGKFVTAGGVRLHYVERGAGDPIVLVHGNATMLEDYLTSGLVDRLAQRRRVILFDRPGFGYSERPRGVVWTAERQAAVIGEAMDMLGIRRATVVGHSWGTLVAVAMAEQEPQRVESLVLLSGFYYPEARADVAMVAPVAMPIIGDVLRYTLSPVTGLALLPATLKAMFGPAPVAPRFKAEFPLSMMFRPWQIRAAAGDGTLMIPGAASLSPGYARLTMPVAVIAGDKDRIVDCGRHSGRLTHDLPHSELDLVEGAGHMVHHTAPERVERAIVRLAQRPASAR